MLRQLAVAVMGRDSAVGGRRWRPTTTDLALAVVLTVLTQLELALAEAVEGPRLAQTVSFAAMTLAVAWRRSFPVGAAAVAAVGLAAQTLTGSAEVVGGFLALAVVTYSVASYAPLVPALLGGVLILGAVFLYPVLHEVSLADEVGNGAIFAGTWGLGRLVRVRQRRELEAHVRLELAQREHQDQVRRIVGEERTRIARELHDIVGHGVSLMVLQSGAARQTLDRDPTRAKKLLATAEGQGRQALVEMERMLGILRAPDGPATEEPHTLDSVGDLVEGLRAAGLEVDCRVVGDRRPLAPGLELSGYRIVQEATTNVVKHADAGHVRIVIQYGAGDLVIRVEDDGRAAKHPPAGGGHGLVGMRERAALFGGSLDAGPAADGGWTVAARLPTDGRP